VVIGKDFVWAHFGKTGGNSTLKMFSIIDRAVEFSDPIDNHEKHLSFEIREEGLGISFKDKVRMLNIRRLHSWILSHINFQNQVYNVPVNDKLLEGIVNIGDPRTVLTDDLTYQEMHVDEGLIYYDYKNVDHWFRTEHLANDFISTMCAFADISDQEKSTIRNVQENVNLNYDRKIQGHLTPEEISLLYENCPIWAEMEKKIYGDILRW